MVTCPSEQQLLALIDDHLDDRRNADAQLHLESCSDCRLRLERILEQNEPALVKSVRERHHGVLPAINGSGCAVEPANDFPVATPSPATVHLRDHELLGDYRIERKIGHGGMGTVYLATHLRLGKLVALKTLAATEPLNEEPSQRFRRELLAMGSLDHPNVASAYDASEIDGIQYLAMEYVDGIDLKALLEQVTRLPEDSVCEIACQVAAGLQHIHERGLVHRDIKPSNIMLMVMEDQARVKILDLGLATWQTHVVDSRLTQAGRIVGTLDFMAPEQFGSATVDLRADIFALGALMVTLLTGKTPFKHSGEVNLLDVVAERLAFSCPSLTDLGVPISPQVDTLIRQMLSRSPADRPSSAQEIVERLASFRSHIGLNALVSRSSASSHRAQTLTSRQQATERERRAVGEIAGTQASQRRVGGRIWTAVFLLSVLSLAAIVIRLATDGGTIVVQCDDPNLNIEILRNRESVDTLTVAQLERETWFRSGEYEIRVPRQDEDVVTIQNACFHLTRNGKQIVTIVRNVVTDADIDSVFPRVPDTSDPEVWIPTPEQQQVLMHCRSLTGMQLFLAVTSKLQQLNPHSPAPVPTFAGDRLLALHWPPADAKLSKNRLRNIWPLAGCTDLTALEFDGDCITDYRPLIGLPLTTLRTHLVVANRNAITSIKRISSLKVLNDLPVKEFWDRVEEHSQAIARFARERATLSGQEQLDRLHALTLQLNPGLTIDRDVFTMDDVDRPSPGNPLIAVHIVGKRELRDLSPLAAVNCLVVDVSDCPFFYDLTPFTGVPSLRELYCERTAIHDLTPLSTLRLTTLGIGSTAVESLLPLRGMPLDHFIDLSSTNVTSLDALRQSTVRRIKVTGPIASFEPLRNMPLELFHVRDCDCQDFEPVSKAPISDLAIGRHNLHATPYLNDLSFLSQWPLKKLIYLYPRKFYRPELERLRSLELTELNHGSPTGYWRRFDEELARIQAFVDRVHGMELPDQVNAVRDQLERNGLQCEELTADQEGRFTVRLHVKQPTQGIWPLRALPKIKTLVLSGAEIAVDLSPLIDLQVEALQAPQYLIAQNRDVLAAVDSLKLIHGEPSN